MQDGGVYILPIQHLLDDTCITYGNWKENDITFITTLTSFGSILSVEWWSCLQAEQYYALVGTSDGTLVCVDLTTGFLVGKTTVEEPIHRLNCFTDENTDILNLLVSCNDG